MSRHNITKRTGSIGDCEASDTEIIGYIGTKDRWRWSSLKVLVNSMGFFIKMQHELCIKSCVGFGLVEGDEGGHFWSEGRQIE